jgi:alpha-glucosidase
MASSDGTGHWWQRAIIYQVYPRSFQDSDGDGIGDLEGIRRRLNHLERLGIDTIWLSPIYPSPMADFGYDVADYGDIDGRFGTMADFDRLIADVHRRGMKLVLDFVPNHSSDHHPWFVQSRSSRESPKRDWYIWRDPKPDGSPPNNWMSHFGGSTWTFDAATGQYYLHSFLKEQPDLNWRNPQVKQAIFDVLRFWLGKGVDGFRVDVIWCLVKDEHFRDNPVNPDWKPGLGDRERLISIYECDRPEMMGLVAEMRAVLDTYPGDRLLIGEIYLPLDRLVAYYGVDLKGAQLPFNFLLIGATWSADSIGRIVADYNAALPAGAWPNWVLSNHDRSRIASRAWAVGKAPARHRPRARPRAHADAVGRLADRRLYHGPSLAAARRARDNQRRRGIARPARDAVALREAHRAAARAARARRRHHRGHRVGRWCGLLRAAARRHAPQGRAQPDARAAPRRGGRRARAAFDDALA